MHSSSAQIHIRHNHPGCHFRAVCLVETALRSRALSCWAKLSGEHNTLALEWTIMQANEYWNVQHWTTIKQQKENRISILANLAFKEQLMLATPILFGLSTLWWCSCFYWHMRQRFVSSLSLSCPFCIGITETRSRFVWSFGEQRTLAGKQPFLDWSPCNCNSWLVFHSFLLVFWFRLSSTWRAILG